MNVTPLSKLTLLEKERRELFRLLSPLTDDALNKRPDAARWSISEILIHLLTSERLTLAYLKKKSLGIKSLRNSGTMESVKLFLLIISQRIPVKYKAPQFLLRHTPKVMDFQQLGQQWDKARNELAEFLETIEDHNLHKLIYKHPVAGRFDVVQALTFMHEHFRHHLPQIKRLIS